MKRGHNFLSLLPSFVSGLHLINFLSQDIFFIYLLQKRIFLPRILSKDWSCGYEIRSKMYYMESVQRTSLDGGFVGGF